MQERGRRKKDKNRAEGKKKDHKEKRPERLAGQDFETVIEKGYGERGGKCIQRGKESQVGRKKELPFNSCPKGKGKLPEMRKGRDDLAVDRAT